MISSSQILLYSGVGANLLCVDSLEKKLGHLIDEKTHCVRKITDFNDIFRQEQGTKTLFIPGGNALEMAKASDLESCAFRVRNCLNNNNIGYFGICAGAILGASNYHSILPPSLKIPNTFLENKHPAPLLKLYPGSCLAPLFSYERSVSANVRICKFKQQDSSLVNSLNIFGPGFFSAETIPDTEILSKYCELPEQTLFQNPKNLSMPAFFGNNFERTVSIILNGSDIAETVFYQAQNKPPVLLTGSHLELDSTIVASELFRKTFPDRSFNPIETRLLETLNSDLILNGYFQKMGISCK